MFRDVAGMDVQIAIPIDHACIEYIMHVCRSHLATYIDLSIHGGGSYSHVQRC